MWKKSFYDKRPPPSDYRTNDFKALLQYVNYLANHKMGYPVSLMTFLGLVNNKELGIQKGSLANILLNNVGDPFKDSETSLLEVKKHEREILSIFERYYGLGLNNARGYVTTGGTEGNFASLWWSKRYLINSVLDDLIKHDDIVKVGTFNEQKLLAELAKIPNNDYIQRNEHLQKIIDTRDAITKNRDIVQQLLTPTVFYAKGPTHYSVPKISEILHLNIRPVEANSDGSINLEAFRKELLLNLGAHPNSPIVVIANIGTTITGAIDDIPGVKHIIESMPNKITYTIHMDGALTGFVLPVLKPFGEIHNYFEELGVNTLAVSAHKYPGLSQPCGIVLAHKKFYEKAFEKSERSIEYVGNILDVTITGSRSGLNVLMFYNALCALGLNINNDKLIKLVNENLANARYLTKKLIDLYGPESVSYPHHFNVTFPKPSQELARKYQLMLTGNKATVCVLSNVTKELIDHFVVDLKNDKETAIMKSEERDYTIQTLAEEHVNSAVDLFAKAFTEAEPITKHLGVHQIDYRPFASEVVKKAVKEGMSKVAVDHSHKVIALAIAEDLADPFVPHQAHYPKLRPVFELLKQLSAIFVDGRKFIKGKVAHVWIAVVDPSYRGHGLSTEIDMACVEGAARKGFDFAYAEFTNELSENVTRHFKTLQLCNRIKYDDFYLDGEKPFAGLKGAAASYVATIRPGVNLDSLTRCYRVTEKY